MIDDQRADLMLQIAQAILEDVEAIKRLMNAFDRSLSNIEQMVKDRRQ